MSGFNQEREGEDPSKQELWAMFLGQQQKFQDQQDKFRKFQDYVAENMVPIKLPDEEYPKFPNLAPHSQTEPAWLQEIMRVDQISISTRWNENLGDPESVQSIYSEK